MLETIQDLQLNHYGKGTVPYPNSNLAHSPHQNLGNPAYRPEILKKIYDFASDESRDFRITDDGIF